MATLAVRAFGLVLMLLWMVGCRREPDLPEYGRVPAFSLTDQSGRAVTPETFRGHPWAAAFMFTRCPSICPEVTRAMRRVQQRAAADDVPLHLVSFSVDPDNDTPEVLRAYASHYQADLARWSFLTGDYNVVKNTAEQGFKMALSGRANASQEHYGITHGSHLVLVDPAGTIRGFYRSSEPEALERLVTDARRLAQ
jgi:protein SCO1/2